MHAISSFSISIAATRPGRRHRRQTSCCRRSPSCSSKLSASKSKRSRPDRKHVMPPRITVRRRGLRDPLLVVSDGAPGIIRAIEECFPRALRQRCLAHKMRNLASKVTEDLWPEFKARAVACYQAASPALARLLRDDIRTYGRDLPSAVSCLEDDFEACIAHLRFPLGHRRVIRTTDEIDKPFSAGSLAHVGTSRALERARQPFCPSKARWPRGLLGCGFVNADSRRRRWPQASVYKAASQQRQSAVALGGLPCSKPQRWNLALPASRRIWYALWYRHLARGDRVAKSKAGG